jgi:hypothetical protein
LNEAVCLGAGNNHDFVVECVALKHQFPAYDAYDNITGQELPIFQHFEIATLPHRCSPHYIPS